MQRLVNQLIQEPSQSEDSPDNSTDFNKEMCEILPILIILNG